MVNIILEYGADMEVGIATARNIGKREMLDLLNRIKLSREEKAIISTGGSKAAPGASAKNNQDLAVETTGRVVSAQKSCQTAISVIKSWEAKPHAAPPPQ